MDEVGGAQEIPTGGGGTAAAAAQPAGAGYAGNEPLRGRPLPGWLRPAYSRPQVVWFGFSWPRALGAERVFWAGALVACLVVLGLAKSLDPDARGIGTHEQLGLPPCGIVEMFGVPCPSCGYTTTFALAADGHVGAAIVNQPFGFLVFLTAVCAVPLTAFSVFGRVSLFACTERWPMGWILAGAATLWLLAWCYKLWLVSAG